MLRFDREGFYLIVGAVESQMLTESPPSLRNIVNRKLPPFQQVAMALNRLVTGHSTEAVGSQFGVSSITVRRCTVKFCNAVMVNLKHLFLKWPTMNERSLVKRQFQRIWGLPNCVGAIDCTHVNMECPDAVLASDYCDRKGRFSIQVQAIVDANMRFLDIVCGWAGSVHDSRIYSLSRVYELRKEYFNGPKINVNGIHVPEYLVGDAGYPLSPHLLIPLPGREVNMEPEERHYNFKQSSTRICVERAFGRLKTVFRILKNDLVQPDMRTVPRMVMACIVLHNIHLSLYQDDVIIEADDSSGLQAIQEVSISGSYRVEYALAKNIGKR